MARTLIPSGRIFRRDGRDGDYVLVHYGDVTLRVRPTLWQEVEPEGFEIGDWVEVRTRGLANEPRTGTIAEIAWDSARGRDPVSDRRERQADRDAVCARRPQAGGADAVALGPTRQRRNALLRRSAAHKRPRRIFNRRGSHVDVSP